MKNSKQFPFEKARRISKRELTAARKAIEAKTGVPRPPRGRPPKSERDRYQPMSIRLHPKVMAWARREARKRGVGYQTIINEALLEEGIRRQDHTLYAEGNEILLWAVFVMFARFISDTHGQIV
jgi:uncharacterized protein (DUF4415 family)